MTVRELVRRLALRMETRESDALLAYRLSSRPDDMIGLAAQAEVFEKVREDLLGLLDAMGPET